MNSELIIKGIAVLLIAFAICIIICGLRGVPFMKNRPGNNYIKPGQLPRRTALILNLMIASVILICALAMLFPIILKYSIFIMIGIIFVFLILLVVGIK